VSRLIAWEGRGKKEREKRSGEGRDEDNEGRVKGHGRNGDVREGRGARPCSEL